MNILILISPEAKAAYFSDFIKVAQEELRLTFHGLESSHVHFGRMDFLEVSAAKDTLHQLVRLSFVQGLFEKDASGKLSPLAIRDDFYLDDRFIFGSKFRGKTNERLTQLLLNLGLSSITQEKPKVLDPMCGRATSLIWAMRYGIEARGIEHDPKAIDDISQICKKWQKVCGASLKFHMGHVGKKNKSGVGRFLEVKSPISAFKVFTGDTSRAQDLMQGEKVDLIISDLPYGIQHFAGGKTRNPYNTLIESIPAWSSLLREKGSMVLAYNSFLPKKEQMLELFQKRGLQVVDTQLSHRMSESILRDIILVRK